MADIKYDIVEEIGVVSESSTGVDKRTKSYKLE